MVITADNTQPGTVFNLGAVLEVIMLHYDTSIRLSKKKRTWTARISFTNSLSEIKAWISNYIHSFCGIQSLIHHLIVAEWHISIGKLTTIGSDNGLSPGRRQVIIWTNAGILLIWPLGTMFSENLIEIHTFLFKRMHLKMASAKWRPFCLSLNAWTSTVV